MMKILASNSNRIIVTFQEKKVFEFLFDFNIWRVLELLEAAWGHSPKNCYENKKKFTHDSPVRWKSFREFNFYMTNLKLSHVCDIIAKSKWRGWVLKCVKDCSSCDKKVKKNAKIWLFSSSNWTNTHFKFSYGKKFWHSKSIFPPLEIAKHQQRWRMFFLSLFHFTFGFFHNLLSPTQKNLILFGVYDDLFWTFILRRYLVGISLRFGSRKKNTQKLVLWVDYGENQKIAKGFFSFSEFSSPHISRFSLYFLFFAFFFGFNFFST